MKQLLSLWPYIVKYKYRMLFGILCVFLTNYFLIYIPNDVKNAANGVMDYIQTNPTNSSNTNFTVIPEHNTISTSKSGFNSHTLKELILYPIAIIFLHVILQGAFLFIMRQMIIVNSRKIEYDIKNDLYKHYQNLDATFYKLNNTGDLMSRITEDLGRVREMMGPALMYLINTAFLLPMVVFNMFIANPILTLFVLLPFPILVISIYYVNKLVDERSEKIQAKLSDLTTFAQESFSGIRVIKAYVKEKEMSNYFYKECNEYQERSLALTRIDSLWFPIIILLIGISNIMVLLIGGKLVIEEKISFGTLLEFMMYVNILTFPVSNIGWVTGMLQRGITSMRRINEFRNTIPAIQSGDNNVDLNNDIIQFKSVSFIYPETGIKALDSISFTIEPGKRYAIVGRTGSGKSTLAELLFRMYDVSSGCIKIGDYAIQDIELISYRSQIGYAPQEVFLFSDTIHNNVVFGADDTPNEQPQKACKMASIHNEIMQLPQQYETRVGERGVTLSGGQKQRISIARAFVNHPKLIVLDDCLSAVDAHTEHTILQQMYSALDGKTALVITHRVFSLQDFDAIIVLEEGRIVESGTHDKLLSKQGVYAQMYEEQLKQLHKTE